MEVLERLKSGQLLGQTELKISTGLTEFPVEIFELADSLELLVLSNNDLSTLPEDFGRLKKLKRVFFNNNAFETFPSVLADCPQLSMISFKSNLIKTIDPGTLSPAIRWLILTDNQLEALPADIGQLSKLQKLMLAGNRLKSLPETLANCENLELIRLSANQLQEMPRWLLSLPRLSWLAYAGNAFNAHEAVNAFILGEALPTACEDALQLGEILGKGASGVIYKSVWHSNASVKRTVAVKMFKGDMTSDGLPADEMRACIAAGQHPNLVSVIGELSGSEKAGLIFSFLAADYKNLGGPPDLDSCTRDTYDEEVSFALPVVLRIARGIASAVLHLHTRGVMHGDLYAHNILVDEVGESILGDFGAASFYDVDNDSLSKSLQQLESRAFGCLLEDLLDRCVVEDSAPSAPCFDRLRQLQADCMQAMPGERPLFLKICESLKLL